MKSRVAVLLVDAGGHPLEPLTARLRQLGFGALRAKTATEAMALLAEGRVRIGAVVVPPDLAVVDLERAFDALREAQCEGPIPMLVSGPRADVEVRARLRDAGVSRAVWEPLDDHTLRFQVNAALAEDPAAERTALRVPTNWPVKVRTAGREKAAKIYSLSSRGAFLATARPSMAKALVHLLLPLPSGDLPVTGEVVMTNVPGNLMRRNLPVGMGVRFKGISEEAAGLVDAFTDSRSRVLQL